MVLSISFFAIYFRIDQKNICVHAIRRDFKSAIAWEYLHLPLHASIISVGGSMPALIRDSVENHAKPVDSGIRYTFALGYVSNDSLS